MLSKKKKKIMEHHEGWENNGRQAAREQESDYREMRGACHLSKLFN